MPYFIDTPPPDSIYAAPTSATVAVGEAVKLTLYGHYDGGDDIDYSDWANWSSANTALATAGSSGFVYGIGAGGPVNITVTFEGWDWLGGSGSPPTYDPIIIPVTVTPYVAHPPPIGRFNIAFGDWTLEPNPTWTRLDDHPNLVTSYTIDRGRSYELDRTDVGRATVRLADPDGILDPHNPDGPWYGQIKPLLQAAISRHNPCTGEWSIRYRGFIADMTYDIDKSQQVNWLTITLVDLMDVLSAVEVQPSRFGDYPPPASLGQVYYGLANAHDRILQVLADIGLAPKFYFVANGSCGLKAAVYTPGESALSVIQEAADGDFPAVSQVYCDRRGRFVFHDRQAKFDPVGASAIYGPDNWDFRQWPVGDSAAVAAAAFGPTAQLREFTFSRSLTKIINSAAAYPADIPDELMTWPLLSDSTSIGKYGIRSWSADNLPSLGTDGSMHLNIAECQRFARYYIDNYAEPQDRIDAIGFRPLRPDDPRAPALWEFLNNVDISDQLIVTVDTPGGNTFGPTRFFVEGIHEDVQALLPDYDDVTLRLDLSPDTYYNANPFGE